MSQHVNVKYSKLKAVLFILVSLVFVGYVQRVLVPVNFEFALGVILLLGVSVSWKSRHKEVSSVIWLWGAVLFLYWFTTVVASIYHAPLGDRGWSVLNVVHSIFPFFFLLLMLYLIKPTIDFFWYLMGVAALVSVSLFVIEAHALGLDKFFNFKGVSEIRLGVSYTHPVKLGIMSNMFFIILLGSLPWAFKKGIAFLSVWSLLIVLVLVGVILTQTRSAWIGWPEAIIGWGAYYFYMLNRHVSLGFMTKTVLVVLPLTVFIGLFSILPVDKIFTERLNLIQSDIEKYNSGETFQTSLGRRFLSYEIALDSIKENPLLGIGEDAFPEFLAVESKALARAKFDQWLKGFSFSHIHNQFLMSWLTKGVFAFISVVLIFVFLIWHFTRGLKRATFENKPIWIAGLVFSIASLLSFLPETPLQKSDTSTHFFLLATLLIAFSVLTEERQNHGSEKTEGEQND